MNIPLSNLAAQVKEYGGYMKKENSDNIGNVSINDWEIAKSRNISIKVIS